jgi:hypothetical protein
MRFVPLACDAFAVDELDERRNRVQTERAKGELERIAEETARDAIDEARVALEGAPARPGWWTEKECRSRRKEREQIAMAHAMRLEGLDEGAARHAWEGWSKGQLELMGYRPTPTLESKWRALSSCESGPWGTVDGHLALELETGRPSRAWRTCGDRWCPTCRRRQTQRIRKRIKIGLERVSSWGEDWRPVPLVLTLRDQKGRSASAAVGLLSRALGLLTSTPEWRAHVRLGIAGLEVPLSTPETRARARVLELARAHNVRPFSKGWVDTLSRRSGENVKSLFSVDDGKGRWWHAHAHVVIVPMKCDDDTCLRCAYLSSQRGRDGLEEHKREQARIPRAKRKPWNASLALGPETRRGQWLEHAWLLEEWRRALKRAAREATTRAERIDELGELLIADSVEERDERRAVMYSFARNLELADELEDHDEARSAKDIFRDREEDYRRLCDAARSSSDGENVPRKKGEKRYRPHAIRYKSPEDRARGPWRLNDAIELRSELAAVVGDSDALGEYLGGGLRVERARGRAGARGAARDVVLREVLKYASKPQHAAGLELGELAELVEAFAGRRRFRAYGELYGLELERPGDEEPKTDDPTSTMYVVDDGSNRVVGAECVVFRTVLPSRVLRRAYELLEQTHAPP